METVAVLMLLEWLGEVVCLCRGLFRLVLCQAKDE